MAVKYLCFLMDYACNTGFGTVSKNIIPNLKQAFGKNLFIDIYAINYNGEMYQEDERTRVCSAKKEDPSQDEDGNPTPDPFGRVGFMRELVNFDYDGIFIIQDVNVVSKNPKGGAMTDLLAEINEKKKEQGKKQFKSIFYFPVDCALVDFQVSGIEFFDLLVTYTQFGKDAVLKHRPSLKDKLAIIPHGNNNKDFYPLECSQEIDTFRKKYFGEKYRGHRFIISNISRNQPRKDIANTIFGFIEAKNNWPKDKLAKPFLYLHMNPEDSEGWQLPIFMRQTSLVEGEDFMFCPDEIKEQGASVALMNIIYNSSDLYLTTTTGEGWGLGITEAMSTKTPVLATNYSSIPEILDNGKRGWLLEKLYPYCSPVGSMIRYQTDLIEVGEKIIEVALAAKDNTPEYQDKIRRAYEYTQSLDWKVICGDWVKYFHEVFGVPYDK